MRALHPDERIYTFWDYFRRHWERNAGLRIDHLLLNRRAARMLSEVGVDRWVRDLPQASDHAPVWAALGPPRRAVRARKKTAAPTARRKAGARKRTT